MEHDTSNKAIFVNIKSRGMQRGSNVFHDLHNQGGKKLLHSVLENTKSLQPQEWASL